MPDLMTSFTDRLFSDWLPSFCEAPHRNLSVDGFKVRSIEKLSEYDARWFMKAVDMGIVHESNGAFFAPRSKAKEFILWEGSKETHPRPITLWIEPIITLGALARLNQEFGWPVDCLGAQSKTWAFDLVCYDNNSDAERIACEVKKAPKEIDDLIAYMKLHCDKPALVAEPENAKERNAYRKVLGIRRSWPDVFWALGPKGQGNVYNIHRDGLSECFRLELAKEVVLHYHAE